MFTYPMMNEVVQALEKTAQRRSLAAAERRQRASERAAERRERRAATRRTRASRQMAPCETLTTAKPCRS